MTVSRPIALTLLLGWLIFGGCVMLSTLAMASMRAQMWQMYKDCPLKPSR